MSEAREQDVTESAATEGAEAAAHELLPKLVLDICVSYYVMLDGMPHKI